MSPMGSMGFPGWPQALPPGKFQGRIKSYNAEKGFGFIDCTQTYVQYQRDVFLHRAQVGDLQVGDIVVFSCEVNAQGMPQAQDVQAIDAMGYPGPRSGGGGGKSKGKGGKGEKGKGKGGEKGKGKGKGKGD